LSSFAFIVVKRKWKNTIAVATMKNLKFSKRIMVKNQSTPELGPKNPTTTTQVPKKEFIPVDANNIEDSKCFDSNGHSCQALIGDDGVVLDLEDCCQMTICEKPCIEAKFRKPSHRKKK